MSRNHRSNRRRFRARKIEVGRPPGMLSIDSSQSSQISGMAYGGSRLQQFDDLTLAQAKELEDQFAVIWIDITGVQDMDLLREFGKQFGIHPLSLEDVANVHQRAKSEKFDHYTYYVTRMVTLGNDFQSEQLSIFHCGKFVITFQEIVGDCLNPLRRRIEDSQGNIRKRPADYLVYSIIDMVLDHYFPVVDQLGERLDELDSQLMREQGRYSPADLHSIRSDLLDLGRWLRPNREMINQILRDQNSSMSSETQVFMRDCYDHVIQLQESIEILREICSDLRAYHLSVVSNRTNEVMKTLTIISSIFIPLGFLAGLYGMNFDNMPELHYRYGYFVIIGLMIAIVTGLLSWFKWRGWFDV